MRIHNSKSDTGQWLCVTVILALILMGLILPGCGKKDKSGETRPETSTQTGTKEPIQPVEPTAPEPTQPGTDETDAVVGTAIDDARTRNPGIGDLRVVSVKIVENWAIVTLEPVDHSTDAASWLMKKSGGTWKVIDFGTAILPENYPDAPGDLFE